MKEKKFRTNFYQQHKITTHLSKNTTSKLFFNDRLIPADLNQL